MPRLDSKFGLLKRSQFISAALIVVVGIGACSRQNAETMLQSGKDFMVAKNYPSALIQLKNSLQQKDTSEVQFLLGSTQQQLGDHAAAASHLRRALEMGYSPEKVYPLLAESMLKVGDVKKLATEVASVELREPAAKALVKTIVGEAQLQAGMTKDATETFSAVLASTPEYPRARLGVARTLVATGDAGKAEKNVDEILQKSPNLPEALLFKADLYVAQGKPDKAVPLLKELVKIVPLDANARFSLTAALIANKNYDEAATEIAAMKKSFPRDIRPHYNEALLASRREEHAKSRDAAMVVLNANPGHLPSLLLAGSAEYQLGSLATAENHLKKAMSIDPTNLAARNLLIATYLRQGQPRKADEIVGPGIKQAPNDPAVLRAAGETAFANNRLEEAAKYYEKALANDKESALIKTRLAQIRMARGDTEQAVLELESASGLDKNQYQADLSLIATFLRKKEFDKALAAASKLEAKQPTNPLSYSVKGVIFLAKQDNKTARASFEKALSIQHNYLPAAQALARMDIADKNPTAAKGRFEAIVQKEPGNDAALLSLAETQNALGESSKVIIATIERAIKASPASVAARTALVKAYLQDRQLPAALQAAQTADAAIPGNAEILEALGIAQFASGEAGQAADTFKKLVAKSPDAPLPLMRLASAEYGLKHIDATMEALRKALKLKPDLLEARRQIIVVLVDTGQVAEAIKEAKLLQKARPKDAIGYALEGDVLASQKRFAEAVAAYAEGMKRQPSSELVVKQHKALREAGKEAEANALASRWQKEHPEETLLGFSIANDSMLGNDLKGSVEQYRQLLAKQPNNPAILNNLASALGELKDSSALGYAEKAYAQAPRSAQIQDTYGWLLAESGDTKRGIELLSSAASAAPKDNEIRLHLAKALLKSGDKAGAKRELETIVKGGAGKVKDEASKLLGGL